MTHFGVLVLTDDPITRATAAEAVAPLLAPYDETGEWFRKGSKWDWWVVGGRWTGSLTDYDPYTDPANMDPCEFCEATGTTTQAVADQYPAYKAYVGKECIQCQGTGKRVRLRLDEYDGDVLPVSELDHAKIAKSFGVIVTPDGEWHEGNTYGWFGASEETMNEGEWMDTVDNLLTSHANATAVVVDCHI